MAALWKEVQEHFWASLRHFLSYLQQPLNPAHQPLILLQVYHGFAPIRMTCPHCGNQAMTNLSYNHYILAVFLALSAILFKFDFLGCLAMLLFFLALLISGFKAIIHICPVDGD